MTRIGARITPRNGHLDITSVDPQLPLDTLTQDRIPADEPGGPQVCGARPAVTSSPTPNRQQHDQAASGRPRAVRDPRCR
ncbi:hypothetical protein DVS28_b0081 (plasmid) [Euzebya pacifica]|uniref:Uncharacterized protein n=1 Tax=Euzebya pacifica TaxID=1608957 RepID=A0A346Y5V4_9ACTN|nr:hypothetical protein DVS28_b0081 [Euzebya pacifica]